MNSMVKVNTFEAPNGDITISVEKMVEHPQGPEMEVETEPEAKRVPRPPNAFMIFGQRHRRLMANQFPDFSNKQISKMLGTQWREMDPPEKEFYHRLAGEASANHLLKHPGYYYSPLEARQRKAERKRKAQQRLKRTDAPQREAENAAPSQSNQVSRSTLEDMNAIQYVVQQQQDPQGRGQSVHQNTHNCQAPPPQQYIRHKGQLIPLYWLPPSAVAAYPLHVQLPSHPHFGGQPPLPGHFIPIQPNLVPSMVGSYPEVGAPDKKTASLRKETRLPMMRSQADPNFYTPKDIGYDVPPRGQFLEHQEPNLEVSADEDIKHSTGTERSHEIHYTFQEFNEFECNFLPPLDSPVATIVIIDPLSHVVADKTLLGDGDGDSVVVSRVQWKDCDDDSVVGKKPRVVVKQQPSMELGMEVEVEACGDTFPRVTRNEFVDISD